MLRAVWSGSITFGLVGIPVRATPVQSPKDVRFDLLHAPCGNKTTVKRYCPQCERDVEDDEMVRGYQYTKGHYVTVEPEEMEHLHTPAKHTLQILDFVDLKDIDPIYYEKPYHLLPAQGGERTYALLHRAMSDAGRVGIGKVALRDREHLALIRPTEGELVMEILAFPDEVRKLDEPAIPDSTRIDQRELDMAKMLIDSMSTEFTPEKYQDEYRNALKDMLQEKVEGGTVTIQASAPVQSEVGDLMDALRQSIAAREGRQNGKAPAEEKGGQVIILPIAGGKQPPRRRSKAASDPEPEARKAATRSAAEKPATRARAKAAPEEMRVAATGSRR